MLGTEVVAIVDADLSFAIAAAGCSVAVTRLRSAAISIVHTCAGCASAQDNSFDLIHLVADPQILRSVRMSVEIAHHAIGITAVLALRHANGDVVPSQPGRWIAAFVKRPDFLPVFLKDVSRSTILQHDDFLPSDGFIAIAMVPDRA